MSYCLLKLRFTTPVHFGSGEGAQALTDSEMCCCADTMFSALCHAALTCGGEDRLFRLLDMVESDLLHISDLFPYDGSDFYLPKPICVPRIRKEGDPLSRKQNKRRRYIAVSDWQEYGRFLRGESDFVRPHCRFGRSSIVDKAAVPDNVDASPYGVGVFSFMEGCGLYMIAKCETEDVRHELETLTRMVGLSGLGGKISAGYGHFEVQPLPLDASPALNDILQGAGSGAQVLLTTALPHADELEGALEGAEYSVVRRGGFAASVASKKKTQYFFSAGSVFQRSFEGAVYSVGYGTVKALRYSKPLFAPGGM